MESKLNATASQYALVACTVTGAFSHASSIHAVLLGLLRMQGVMAGARRAYAKPKQERY